MRQALVRLGSVLLSAPFLALLSAQSNSVEKAAKASLRQSCTACHGERPYVDLDLREPASILRGGKRGRPLCRQCRGELTLQGSAARRGAADAARGKRRSRPLKSARCATGSGGARWSRTLARQVVLVVIQKAVRPVVPAGEGMPPGSNPIDAFILSKLEEKGLHPAAPSDRRTLVPGLISTCTAYRLLPNRLSSLSTTSPATPTKSLVDRFAGIAAIWRALGPLLAGLGSLRRHVRV